MARTRIWPSLALVSACTVALAIVNVAWRAGDYSTEFERAYFIIVGATALALCLRTFQCLK